MDCYMLHLLTVQDLKRHGRRPLSPRRREARRRWLVRFVDSVRARHAMLAQRLKPMPGPVTGEILVALDPDAE